MLAIVHRLVFLTPVLPVVSLSFPGCHRFTLGLPISQHISSIAASLLFWEFYLIFRDSVRNAVLYCRLNLFNTDFCFLILDRIDLTFGLRCSLAMKLPLRVFFFFFGMITPLWIRLCK